MAKAKTVRRKHHDLVGNVVAYSPIVVTGIPLPVLIQFGNTDQMNQFVHAPIINLDVVDASGVSSQWPSIGTLPAPANLPFSVTVSFTPISNLNSARVKPKPTKDHGGGTGSGRSPCRRGINILVM